MLDELQSYPFCPAVSPADPLKSQQCVEAMTLALTSWVFPGALGHASSGRNIYPMGTQAEGPSTKYFLLFRDNVQTKLLMTPWMCMAHQRVGVDVNHPPQVWECCCSAGLTQRMFYWGGCFLLACLGLWSESCWPALTHKGLSLIIFCLGKLLLFSQLIYLYLPNEHFIFSSGQKSERKCLSFSHQKSWAAFHGGWQKTALTLFKLVKLMLLCESFSLWLLSSFTQADSVLCSEQAAVKVYIDFITILLSTTLPGPRVYVFFPHSKSFLKPSRLLCEPNQVLKILK